MSVRIVTDSTADLPPEICRELDITVVPLTVNFGDTGYKDGVDLSADEFYKKLIAADKLPTTSQPSAGAFGEAYKDVAKDTDEILSIHIFRQAESDLQLGPVGCVGDGGELQYSGYGLSTGVHGPGMHSNVSRPGRERRRFHGRPAAAGVQKDAGDAYLRPS